MNSKNKNICTISLIVINIAAFIILSFMGNTLDASFMADHGAVFWPYVTEGKEYYRLFTSMFMHFGVEHLINNMIVLGAIGIHLEPHLGKIKFLIIYFISGLGAGLLSLFVNMMTRSISVSAGASGAIFGLMGALLYVVVKNKGLVEGIDKSRMIFMVILSLYLGFTSPGTDNIAHIGGLMSGFVLALVLYRGKVSRV